MLRIATFNAENLDINDDFERRMPVLKSTFDRLNADVICLQEVHSQESNASGEERELKALKKIIEGTEYEDYHLLSTVTTDDNFYHKRNLVTLSKYPFRNTYQYRNDKIEELKYNVITSDSSNTEAERVGWERPILHAEIELPNGNHLHVLNLHLKSKIPTDIDGQKVDDYTWKSAAGWAEGYFISSMKRVGQALETRVMIDNIFDNNEQANIVVCGDFNAEPDQVPVEAIRGKIENTQNANLRSRMMVPCSQHIPESVRYTLIHQGQGNLLDHMLISQSLLQNFKGATILNENLHDESLPYRFDTSYPESDHAPFVSEFVDIG